MRRRDSTTDSSGDRARPGGGLPALGARLRGAIDAVRASPETDAEEARPRDVIDMIGLMGTSLLESSQATNDIQRTLEEVALRYERPELTVFVLPTVVLIEDASTGSPRTEFFPARTDQLRLDQAGEVERTIREALRTRPEPARVIADIRAVRGRRSRFGAVLTVLGHLLLTVGFGLVLNPTAAALPVYVVLGVFVGIVVRVGARMPTLALVLPVVTSFGVTVGVELWAHPFAQDEAVRLIAPALMSFLPGLTLTIAAVELTSGQVMAGASRLSYGFARLGLLAFGVYAGIVVVGAPAHSGTAPATLGWWAPWVGVLLVAVGYYLFSSAPRGSLLWIAAALSATYAAQLLGDLLVGASLSSLVGAMVVAPIAAIASRMPRAPSASVMMTCAYWLLVPGALGFMGISELASGVAGGDTILVETLVSLIAIAIGMMVGAGLTHDAIAVRRGWRAPSSGHAQSVTGEGGLDGRGSTDVPQCDPAGDRQRPD